MLVKLLSRHGLSAIEHSIRYILNESKTVSKDGELVQPILQNLRSAPNDLQGLSNELIDNESFRKVTSNRVFMFHEILSFGSGDKSKITPEMVQDIIQKYLQLRGDDLVCIAIAHFNTDSVHCHIVSGGTRYRDSTSSGLRKSDLLKIKQELEIYVQQNYPQLEHSHIQHGQGQQYISEKEYQAGKNGLTKKEELRLLIEQILSASKSRTQFTEKLAKAGYLTYERNRDGMLSGIVSEQGQKHRFSTLGISLEQVQQLTTAQELSREQHLLRRLQDINQRNSNEDQLERD